MTVRMISDKVFRDIEPQPSKLLFSGISLGQTSANLRHVPFFSLSRNCGYRNVLADHLRYQLAGRKSWEPNILSHVAYLTLTDGFLAFFRHCEASDTA